MNKRIQNVFIAFLSFIFFFVRGSAKKLGGGLRYVIIQPTGNLGDMVCITPLFTAIKKSHQGAYVTVIGSAKNRALLVDHAYVDDYIDMPDSYWELIRILRKRGFNKGIVIDFNPANLGSFFMGNVEEIACLRFCTPFERMAPLTYRAISWLAHEVEYFPGKYIPDQYLELLKPFGIGEMKSKKSLAFSRESYIKISELLNKNRIDVNEKIVAIAPGAGSDIKTWRADNFASIANYIQNRYKLPIVIIGGPNDAKTVAEMIGSLNDDVRYWSPGPQALDELKATLAHAYLVIGNDSGAIHVGEALGAKTLTIAGTTDVNEHMLEDQNHRVIGRKTRGTVLYRSYIGDETQINLETARLQMNQISTDEVKVALDYLLQ